MPVRFSVSDFFQGSGNAAAEFSESLRDGVAGFACGLWSSYPDFITKGTNPASSFARGYMNSMCSPIQPPVPPPTIPFTGGQCCDTQYRVDVSYTFIRCFNGNIEAQGTPNFTVTGQIKGLRFREDPLIPGQWYLELVYQDCSGTEFVTLVNSTTRCIRFGGCFTTDPQSPDFNCIDEDASSWSITSIVRTGGAPDVCGNPPPSYQSPEPTGNDLNTTINVTVNDGLDVDLEVQYITLSNQYNFPMNFKVNGTNVSLDIGGINVYAPDGFGSPSGGNDVPPPGSDGGEDGAGNPITKTYPEIEYPVAPESPVPREVSELIEYLVCMDGVIETVQTTLKAAVGGQPLLLLIIDILGQILTDLCETPEASLGLPEYYGLRPGADRPAIVFLWKEFVGNKWGASTYSSTVHHPSPAAIANIDNLTSIQKFTGRYRRTVGLLDGSQLRTTGNSAAAANDNFTFLVDQVDPSFLPSPLGDFIVEAEDTRIAEKMLTLRQVEYYPIGKKENVPPTIKRVINP